MTLKSLILAELANSVLFRVSDTIIRASPSAFVWIRFSPERNHLIEDLSVFSGKWKAEQNRWVLVTKDNACLWEGLREWPRVVSLFWTVTASSVSAMNYLGQKRLAKILPKCRSKEIGCRKGCTGCWCRPSHGCTYKIHTRLFDCGTIKTIKGCREFLTTNMQTSPLSSIADSICSIY